jgi:hypothetical protein
MRLIPCGDYDSDSNQKIRKAAFNIVFAITRAFLPNIPTDGFSLLVADCFRIKTRHLIEYKEWFLVEVGMYEYCGVGHDLVEICYWHISDKGEMSINSRTTSLDAARIVAEHIAHGWLPGVLKELEDKHGHGAAAKLAKELGLPLEIFVS